MSPLDRAAVHVLRALADELEAGTASVDVLQVDEPAGRLEVRYGSPGDPETADPEATGAEVCPNCEGPVASLSGDETMCAAVPPCGWSS